MSAYVLDSSAALAFLWREPGAEQVAHLLGQGNCVLGAVNAAEIITKAVERGLPLDRCEELLRMLDVEVIDLDASLAVLTGQLRTPTRHLGLSLGDRACLALAKARNATALTADRSWLQLDLGIAIECIRPL